MTLILMIALFFYYYSTGGAALSPYGTERIIAQPVPGAVEFEEPKVCAVDDPRLNNSNATSEIKAAIDACGDLPGGGVVVIASSLVVHSASLWLRSNLTLRVEGKVVGTASGYGNRTDPSNSNVSDAPLVYTRREGVMTWAPAGLVNGGRCIRLKDPLVGWDDCAAWRTLENVVVEGRFDGNARGWLAWDDKTQRPALFDLLWIDGLTLRGLSVRNSGYWTLHPTFCDNVRVANADVETTGRNTDGLDVDSSWNVYVGRSRFRTGDDNIALKAGRDWSGRMVNASTRNVLVEATRFGWGNGVAVGSETSGWIQDVVVRDVVFEGTERAAHVKSKPGRGGGARNITFENASGLVQNAVVLTLNYGASSKNPDTLNASSTPHIDDITLKDLDLRAIGWIARDEKKDHYAFFECSGLAADGPRPTTSALVPIKGVVFENVTVRVRGFGTPWSPPLQRCELCEFRASPNTSPPPCSSSSFFSSPAAPQPPRTTMT
ncbi:hypothetical protein CTAYLR_004856 [Chrysophaeum taylorii]|uniref:Polygalacturonase n=1 Tax=Chrysophaeum taylorii TaxID=2483200 RepID=A0AAD7UE59_9STRA|nr:hypothetical protein CTAYLR_004856 [Chrysophaeum taylorii]